MKKMIKASSTRSTISSLQRRIDDLEIRLSEPDLDEDERIDIGMELADLREQLNFAWQDDEAEYMYALERQEFNPDGSLKGYDDVEGATNPAASAGSGYSAGAGTGVSDVDNAFDMLDFIVNSGVSYEDIAGHFMRYFPAADVCDCLEDMIREWDLDYNEE